ncbi:hypothetical protein BG004_000501 [Podila humilis]|nr:hypothetical protein BG004_000501 [Podila humilis]
MATFSSKTFNSALYQSFRPGYSTGFFNMIYNYHAKNNGQFTTAADVGTGVFDAINMILHNVLLASPNFNTVSTASAGTGQVASVLAEKFANVHGIDPSSKMLEAAVQKPNIFYHVSKAEDLSMLSSGSVDLLTVAQALHWFNHPTFFSEVKRVLKPSGTFAAIGYNFTILKDYPRATKRIFALGDEPDQLGTFWEPGRLIVEKNYKSIDVPLADVERYYFPDEKSALPEMMASHVTMGHFRQYIKTWSSYKNYLDKYPERPDIVDQTIDAILKEENLSESSEVDITWPGVIILGRNA